MMLQCLLIDDEPPALKVLSRYISDIGGMEVVGQCKNAIEAIEILRNQRVDVIFLDIKMPRIVGTDFLKSLSHPPKVIFVTAYREFAVDGFELDAVDYLVKPVSFERFLKAVTKLNRIIGRDVSYTGNSTSAVADAFVYLKVNKDMKKIFIDQLLYIESCKDYVKIFLTDGKSFLVKQSITAMENLFSDQNFLRVHRSYIISMDNISSYNGISIRLGKTEIPIGRLYKHSVLERLQGRS
ncbi:MAG: response regulator transcription factor [Chitinophagaceae bacterium]|nr:response regulator transcription factor [Chitinophagaceae bacterium]